MAHTLKTTYRLTALAFSSILFLILDTTNVAAQVVPAGPRTFKTGFTEVLHNILKPSGLAELEFIPFLISLIKFALGFIAVVALIVIIYGGFLYVTAAGDESKAANGKRAILYALVGILIIGASILLINTAISLITVGGTVPAPAP